VLDIYGNHLSGNCHKITFVCDRIGLPYRWIEIDILKNETRTPEFLAMNPAGQVPFVRFDDGRILAQSNAIMLYLAEGSDLVPSDSFDRVLMNQWLFWEQYSHETAIAVRRYHAYILKKPDSEIDPVLIEKGHRALGVMEGHLATWRYFVADRLSLADLALVAYTRFAHEAGFDLAQYPHTREWVGRVKAELKLTS